MALQIPSGALGSATFPHRKYHGMVDEIRYAHPDGDNTKDGLTWGTAKKDVVSAFDALPAIGGTICFADNTACDSVNTDRGLWLIGPADPSYASPPTGFRQQKSLRLIGMGGQTWNSNSHYGPACSLTGGSGTDRTKPTIWFAATSSPIYMENVHIQYPAVAIRIGMRANGANEVVNTANITLRGCSFALNQIMGNGPGMELGYVFWLFMYDCTFNGNAVTTPITAASIVSGTTARFTIGTHALVAGDTVYVSGVTPAGYNGNWQVNAVAATTFDADIGTSPGAGSSFGTAKPTRHYRRAAIAHDTVERITGGTPLPAGLITMQNCNLNGGGVHYAPIGTSASGRISMQNITYEGDFGSEPQPPALHVRTTFGAAAMPSICSGIHVENVEMADGNFVDGAVLVDGIATSPQTVTVVDTSLTGNGTSIGGLAPSRRVTAINAAGLWGHSPAAARSFGAAPIPFTNLAPQDVSTWGSKPGTATVTTGKPAPDGTTLAARLSAGSNDSREIYRASITTAVGDWVVAGVWHRLHSGGTVTDTDFPILSLAVTGIFENGSSFFVLKTPSTSFLSDGGWSWLIYGAKVVSGPGAGELIMSLRVNGGHEVDYYAPLLVRVPVASVVDDDDMRDFVRYCRTWSDGPPAGSISTLLGQKLIARGGLGVGNSAAATTPGSVVKKMEVFSETGASLGFVPIYSTIT